MKAVLISIQPKWCELIASGIKTIEVRKTRPKIDVPFKCYIYESKGARKFFSQPLPIPYYEGKGKVIGEFVCDEIYSDTQFNVKTRELLDNACLTLFDIAKYLKPKQVAHFWHISNLKIYDKPKELSEFKKINQPCWYGEMNISKRDCHECKSKDCFIQRPPQSWCYVEEKAGADNE